MKYKGIISDLDGTLLNSNHQISNYTKEVIKKVIDKGIKFVIATGRHYIDASHFFNELGLETYLITSNGANAHDYQKNLLVSKTLNDEALKELLTLQMEESVSAHIFTSDKWFVEKYFPEYADYHKESGFKPEIVDFKSFNGGEALKICYIAEDPSKLLVLEEQLKNNNNIKGKVDITYSLDICLEVMPLAVCKGKTLETIFQLENLDPSEVIAFGDGLNDIEMLSCVGKGLVMGNASERLKSLLPNNEVIGSCDEDAVAKYIENLFLND